MGKIRIKTFGDEAQEATQKEKDQIKKQEKKAREAAKSGSDLTENTSVEGVAKEVVGISEAPKINQAKKTKKTEKVRSNKYQEISKNFDKTKIYPLSEALELLVKMQRGKFDETVELHLNTLATGLTGSITLPHGTGKQTKVVIATDALIAEIEKGIINFDILVAEPTMMAKLAKVAKILGPRGLMPNPKNGTITPKPEEVVKKYEGGQINFKTESKSPIMHLTVGKVSFGAKKLTDNIESLISAIKKSNIVNVTLKSTMSPGIKIKI